ARTSHRRDSSRGLAGLLRKKRAVSTAGLTLVSPQRLQRPLPSLPRLQLQLSSSPPRRLSHPRDLCQPKPPRRDGSCDNRRSIWKVALFVKASDRTARADSIRIPCPS